MGFDLHKLAWKYTGPSHIKQMIQKLKLVSIFCLVAMVIDMKGINFERSPFRLYFKHM